MGTSLMGDFWCRAGLDPGKRAGSGGGLGELDERGQAGLPQLGEAA